MDADFEHLAVRAATIDELLSDAYQVLPGQKHDADRAAARLAAWCRSCSSGDWPLFARRLRRDGLSIEDVLATFATVAPNPAVPAPPWLDDAARVAGALRRSENAEPATRGAGVAFDQLLTPVVRDAQRLLWTGIDPAVPAILTGSAHADLRHVLLTTLSDLCAPAFYERFAQARRKDVGYREFVAEMRAAGFVRLFNDKPVLLRLLTSLTRQWIDTSREMISRLAVDAASIRSELLGSDSTCRVRAISTGMSDPHNLGRTVSILDFEDGSRVVYKPKDVRVDRAWAGLIDLLNHRAPPVDLRAMRVLARGDYGWTEFIEHTGCDRPQDFPGFFRRAGALLALFHVFVAADMHQENIVASGSHPVPVDLEMILQATDTRFLPDNDDGAVRAIGMAMQTVSDSVLTIGLLPAYGRASTGEIFMIGGVNSNSSPRVRVTWTDLNTDAMQPIKVADTVSTTSNLPYSDGCRGSLGEHLDDFMAGFGDYARFLRDQVPGDLFDPFVGLTTRKVIRPTRFYLMLLDRLRDHRCMHDGVLWSAQADFTARLADWDGDRDPLWPLQRGERLAMTELNVPHFTTTDDGHEVHDRIGTAISCAEPAGLSRAETRLRELSDEEIGWQLEVIRQSTDLLRSRPTTGSGIGPLAATGAPVRKVFTAETDAVASAISAQAVRSRGSAAWIGLDWLGDSEIAQLVVLGPDLYNGSCGIAVFLAAHSAVTGAASSQALARSAIAGVRHHLRGRNPARLGRMLGLGAGLGLGSIIYALTVIGTLLDDEEIIADAHVAAELITDDLISADHQLDVLSGCAGAILGLLRLYRQTHSGELLMLAAKCGRRLLDVGRVGPIGGRTWPSPAFGRPLNGMAHGAAGYAYSLAALAHATGTQEFAEAATECAAFEQSTFDAERGEWADLRSPAGLGRPCKWCYGAPGIGLARMAMIRFAGMPLSSISPDIDRALAGVENGWPAATDTLCCGTPGSIEFLSEAADLLDRRDLAELAQRRLLAVVQGARTAGDYRWSSGTGRFNLGLFRGIAGVGYTLLRSVDRSLPNILIWE